MYIKVLQKNKIKLNNSYFLLLDVYSKTRNKVCSILKSDAYKILIFSTTIHNYDNILSGSNEFRK
jgi:hypothetical protein